MAGTVSRESQPSARRRASFWTPPRFENPVDNERARLLHWILSWLLVVYLIFGSLMPLFAEDKLPALAMELVILAVIVAGLRLLRRNVSLAGAAISLASWTLQTWTVYLNGFSGATMGGYIIVVVVTGLFWDGRRAAWMAVLSCASVLAFGWADAHGWMPERPPRSSMVVAAEISIQILVILVLLGAGLRFLRSAQDRVRREARRHARLIARSPDGVFEVDAKGCIVSFNPAAERLAGLAAADVLGRRWWELGMVGEADARRGQEALARVFAKGGDTPFEVEVIHAQGDLIPVEIYPRRIVRADGSIGLMATCRDLRARRRVERERAELEAMLQRSRHLESVGRLAGGVAHDFNNLLTVVRSNTQLLLDGPEPGPHWREDVEQIEGAAKRASALTQQLLAFARRETLETSEVDINEPLESMRELLERLCGTSVKLVFDLDPELPRAQLDRTRFEQVVLNLATNARDAMPEGGTLRIRSAPFEVDRKNRSEARGMPPGRYVWLRVEDDGVGMDEDTQAHVFEPFFTTRREHGGTGLGLATVHGIVAQSSGYVFLESRPEEGTAFDIFFPVVGQGAAASTPAAAQSGEGRASILLVEDEPVAGQITQRVLEEAGYEVAWACDLGEARAIWDQNPEAVDLVLCDVVLPDGLGPQLVRQLRREREDLRVVYISGFDDAAIGRSLDSEGSGLALLRKPVSIQSLLGQVRDALNAELGETGRIDTRQGD